MTAQWCEDIQQSELGERMKELEKSLLETGFSNTEAQDVVVTIQNSRVYIKKMESRAPNGNLEYAAGLIISQRREGRTTVFAVAAKSTARLTWGNWLWLSNSTKETILEGLHSLVVHICSQMAYELAQENSALLVETSS